MSDVKVKISIALDWKKNRIRITRPVMESLGNPPYIQLLVNPNGRALAVRALQMKSKDIPCEIVRYEGADERYIEMYSTLLFEKLSNSFSQFDKKATYKVFGEVLLPQRVAIFDLMDYKKLENGTGEVDHGTI